MSLIGLLTATEKQVHLGRLHMRLIHWHHKNMQENHSDCSGVAQHALVLGSSGHVQPNPTEPAQSAQPVDSHSIRSLTEI